MKKLYVYADFDWLKEVELVGELGYESLRGSDSYSFKFADNWIKKYNAISLSEDINNYPGIQYTQPDKDIFGCFAEAFSQLLYYFLMQITILLKLSLRFSLPFISLFMNFEETAIIGLSESLKNRRHSPTFTARPVFPKEILPD